MHDKSPTTRSHCLFPPSPHIIAVTSHFIPLPLHSLPSASLVASIPPTIPFLLPFLRRLSDSICLQSSDGLKRISPHPQGLARTRGLDTARSIQLSWVVLRGSREIQTIDCWMMYGYFLTEK